MAHRLLAVILLLTGASGAASALSAARAAHGAQPWHFIAAGDSRNCGDVVMPSIAAAARSGGAAFYWHLGDLRAIYDFDEDYRQLHPDARILEYLKGAWPDFQRNQVEPFGDIPFVVGIGNHETVPPKTREDFVLAFADWLDAPFIREQRLKDDPHDHQVRTYYHWVRDGIDFLYLDNATADQFDPAQLQWLAAVIDRDRRDPAVRAVVAGMHEALPNSLAHQHSMNDAPTALATGLAVYGELLELNRTKPVYVLASHSHFVMQNVFDTPYWREHGGVLPGWIIGTAGAYRYALPPGADQAAFARTHVYGYLLATVSPAGADDRDPVHFEFREVAEAAVPQDVVGRFGEDFVQRCYQGNAEPAAR